MLTDPQKKHLQEATKRLTDSLDEKQQRKLYFLIDDILQYGCYQATWIVYNTLTPEKKHSKGGSNGEKL